MNSPVTFSDTKIAFEHKSDSDLDKDIFLFRLINNNFLVKAGQPLLKLALQLGLPVKGVIKSTVFRHFVGGETIEECETVIATLNKFKVSTILDYSGEGKENEEDFKLTFQYILSTIDVAKKDKRIAFCVFKPTGISRHELLEKVSLNKELTSAEKEEFEKMKNRVEEICKRCYDAGIPVFVDAEETWIQKAIDDLVLEMMAKYNTKKAIVYNTLQMYRTDRVKHLKELFDISKKRNFFIGLKLVRGAYLEKERKRAEKLAYPSPLHASKQATDNDFNEAITFCADNYETISVCAGTHNESSTKLLADLMAQKTLPNNHPHFYFSQLYGMSDHISFNLSKAGYNVAKYVPFGPVKTVMPYLFRRAEENTAIAGQMSRELALIIQEKQRRKK